MFKYTLFWNQTVRPPDIGVSECLKLYYWFFKHPPCDLLHGRATPRQKYIWGLLSAGASPPPRTAAIGPHFSGDLFSRHCPGTKFISMGPLRSPFSLPLPLRQRIKPFTANKAVSWPFQGSFTPCPPPPVGEFGGGLRRLWSYAELVKFTQDISPTFPLILQSPLKRLLRHQTLFSRWNSEKYSSVINGAAFRHV